MTTSLLQPDLRRDCDLAKGDIQCPSILLGDGGYLNCRFVLGHPGKHKTSYDNGIEWEDDPDLISWDMPPWLRAFDDIILPGHSYEHVAILFAAQKRIDGAPCVNARIIEVVAQVRLLTALHEMGVLDKASVQLADAARGLPVSGPVSHRIRVLISVCSTQVHEYRKCLEWLVAASTKVLKYHKVPRETMSDAIAEAKSALGRGHWAGDLPVSGDVLGLIEHIKIMSMRPFDSIGGARNLLDSISGAIDRFYRRKDVCSKP